MSETFFLSEEQKALLVTLVEAARRATRDQRQPFMISHGLNEGTRVNHPGLPDGFMKIYPGDVRALTDANLLLFSQRDMFDVHQRGFAYYERLKRQTAEPVRRVEVEVRSYLASERFQQTYPEAYGKWSKAEGMLWGSDSDQEFTTIGHRCREALQEFADTLVRKYQPPNVGSDKSQTVARFKSVLSLFSAKMGEKEKAFLDAIVVYWGTVNDLAQRQEHGAQKEGQQLIFEDARRLVFQTLVVMFEIDRALLHISTEDES